MATYYVKTTGNDSNDGLSTDDSRAWLTLQKAADTAVAGDTVMVMAGTYAGARFYINSGTASNPIIFKTYQGNSVILTRELTAGTNNDVIPIGHSWTNVSGNRWRSQNNSVVGSAWGLMRNNSYWLAETYSSANVTVHGDEPWYFWDSSNKRVDINSTTDPSLDSWVAIGSTSNRCIYVYRVDYLIFDGFICEGGYDGIKTGAGNIAGNEANNLIFRNIVSRYNGRRGMSIEGEPLAPTSGHLVENCTIHTNGEHGFKFTDDNSSTADGSLSNITLDGITVYNNTYHGIQCSNGGKYITIKNCIAYDNGIFPCGRAIADEGCASSASNYNNGVADNITYDNCIGYSTGTRTYQHSGTITSGLSFFSIDNNILIKNCKFYNNPNHGIYAISTGTYGSGNVVKNNVCYGNAGYGIYLSVVRDSYFYHNTLDLNTTGGIYISSSSTGNVFKNNAVVCATGGILINVPNGYTAAIDYNYYYSPDATPFTYNSVAYSFADYKTNFGQELDSALVDFTSQFANYAGKNYALTANSVILKNSGADLTTVVDDDI